MIKRALLLLPLALALVHGLIAQTTTTTALTASTQSPAPGSTVTLTATLSPATAQGTVQFKDNGTNVGSAVTINNGVATFNVTSITSGTHNYTAVYSGATVTMRYTTDGSTPTGSSAAYTSSLSVPSSQTIKVIATSTGSTSSGVYAQQYTIGALPSLAPTMSPYTGTFASLPTVTLSSATSGSDIWYTTDGSTAATSGTPYTAPIALTGSGPITLQAIAAKAYVNDLNDQTDTKRVSFGPGWKLCTISATAVKGLNGNTSFTSSACGGVGSIVPSSITVDNGASPSLNSPADSMIYSQTTTTPGSSSFTDSLLIHNAGANDNGVYLTSDFYVWDVCNGQKDNREMDQFVFDKTNNVDDMAGMQCNGTTGVWQTDPQDDDSQGGWVNVKVGGNNVSCTTGNAAVHCGQWDHIQVGTHRILGDTACNDIHDGISAFPCIYYDYIKVNGVLTQWNQVRSANHVPSGWQSQSGHQFQIDQAASGASSSNPITSTLYIDNDNFRLTGPPSSITTATYTILAAAANTVPPPVFSPIAGFYAAAQTVTLSDSGGFATSTSNSLAVITTSGKANSTTTISAAQGTVSAKSTDVLTVSVAPSSATGQVTIQDGTNTIATLTLSGGTVQYTAPALTTGTHTYTATYAGNSSLNGSTSSSIMVNVTPISTTAAVSATPSSVVFGNNITLNATVTPSSGPTGNVNFMEGSTVLGTVALSSSGTASFTVSVPSVGTHNYTVAYLGDIYYDSATSTATSVTVTNSKINTSITLTSSASTVTAGTVVTLTGTMTGGVTSGSMSFVDAGTSIGSGTINSSGVATINTSGLTAGTHVFMAIYAGDSTHNGSTSPNIQVVVNPSSSSTCYNIQNANMQNGNVYCQ